jgi:signal transduction histidine kinase
MERVRGQFIGLGLGMITLVVIATALSEALTTAPVLAVFALSGSFLLISRTVRRPLVVATFCVMSLAVVALYLLISATPVALFVLASFATVREPRRWLAAVLGVATILHVAVQLSLGRDTPFSALATVAGVGFVFAVCRLLVSERHQRERIAQLLTEVEERRKRERDTYLMAERGRMAREMHDVLAHTLSGLAIQLEGARIIAADAAVPDALRESVERAHDLSRAGLVEAKRAVAALRGDQLPGVNSLSALVAEHRLASGSSTQLTVTGEPATLDADANLAIYRTAQEALSNVRKHAQGANVVVTLDWQPQWVVLEIVDSGALSEAGTGEPGYGLTGMAERAQLLGATLLTGAHGEGFRVRLEVPVDRELSD